MSNIHINERKLACMMYAAVILIILDLAIAISENIHSGELKTSQCFVFLTEKPTFN